MWKNFFIGLIFGLSLQEVLSDYEFGVVMDGGSTHTGLYISNTIVFPTVDRVCEDKFARQLDALGELSNLPKGNCRNEGVTGTTTYQVQIKNFVQFFLENIMNWVRITLSNKTLNPFQFSSEQAVILSGEEEASFGWMSVNLLENRLTRTTSNVETFGALDMGGQSTQISFAALPSSDILEDCTVLRIFGSVFRVYAHSFLTYGMNGMRSQVQQLAYDKQKPTSETSGVFWNPCLQLGYNNTVTVVNSTKTQVNVIEKGSGSSRLCSSYIRELFQFVCFLLLFVYLFCVVYSNDTRCVTGSCSILGEYQPLMNLDNITFYAFSNYAFTIDDLQLSNTSSLAALNSTAQEICSLFWGNFTVRSLHCFLFFFKKKERVRRGGPLKNCSDHIRHFLFCVHVCSKQAGEKCSRRQANGSMLRIIAFN
ncbi:hypothetical protein RFI_15281 [Reticulomyxa filosa]|uniref:Uncharacterized protein n=1 Tax=Reticulomyxa filosa TaxID=46433 RepID=X6N9F6_RETFI|nr:hypothetical protein RFI_15281 [Reticulomyxa filosa]|eukprot:ETO21922.1 hypothetical protein RFI_15281 [Reticulomyxa filosa]